MIRKQKRPDSSNYEQIYWYRSQQCPHVNATTPVHPMIWEKASKHRPDKRSGIAVANDKLVDGLLQAGWTRCLSLGIRRFDHLSV